MLYAMCIVYLGLCDRQTDRQVGQSVGPHWHKVAFRSDLTKVAFLSYVEIDTLTNRDEKVQDSKQSGLRVIDLDCILSV